MKTEINIVEIDFKKDPIGFMENDYPGPGFYKASSETMPDQFVIVTLSTTSSIPMVFIQDWATTPLGNVYEDASMVETLNETSPAQFIEPSVTESFALKMLAISSGHVEKVKL